MAMYTSTVEPPHKGHVKDNINSVLCREVVLFSEVQNVLEVLGSKFLGP